MAKHEEDFLLLDDGNDFLADIEKEVLTEMYGEEEAKNIIENVGKEIDVTEDMPTDEEIDATIEELTDDEFKASLEEPELSDEEIIAKYGKDALE